MGLADKIHGEMIKSFMESWTMARLTEPIKKNKVVVVPFIQ